MIESKAMNKKLKREIREFGKRREKETNDYLIDMVISCTCHVYFVDSYFMIS